MPISLVEVDSERCAAVAALLRRVEIPSAEEDAPLLGVGVKVLPNLYLALVAICHQTSPKGGRRLEGVTDSGQSLFGWDYLRARWAERIVQDPDRNTPEFWANIGEKDLELLLQDANGVSTITDLVGRTELLRDLGEGMHRPCARSADELHRASRGMLESEEPLGLYGRLARLGLSPVRQLDRYPPPDLARWPHSRAPFSVSPITSARLVNCQAGSGCAGVNAKEALCFSGGFPTADQQRNLAVALNSCLAGGGDYHRDQQRGTCFTAETAKLKENDKTAID